MATPPTIDLDAWLAPISEAAPAGKNLAYDPRFDAIREARRAEDDTNQGDWKRETKVADWDEVIALGETCLCRETKDLQIAAWVTEALTHRHQFAGLRDGLRLMHGIQERFWGSYYPEVDDGDLESRHGPFLFLNDSKLLPFLIRGIPLTRGLGETPYSLLDHAESRETDNAIKKAPDKAKTILAGGKITGKDFDDQVAQSPRAFYEGLVADLNQATEAFRAFDQETDTLFGRDAPSLLNVSKALEEVSRLLAPIVAAKRLAEPDPEPELEPELPPEDGAIEGSVAEENGHAGVSEGSGPASAMLSTKVADLGRVLIDFRSLAQQLAETGMKLEENRKQHAEHQAKLKELDAEYENLSKGIGRDGEAHQLLSRFLKLQGKGSS